MNGHTYFLQRAGRFAQRAYIRGFLENRVRQLINPGHKIFVIGYNRCATANLHHFFRDQGLKSFHWREGDLFLAKEIYRRKDNDAELRGFLSRWTVYSDLFYLTDEQYIEAQHLYETYARIFPEAYFILNDRDVDRWIGSRLRHIDGDFLTRYLKVHGGTKEDAVKRWSDEFLAHRAAALKYFENHPKFLRFYIDKPDPDSYLSADDAESLVTLLRPSYTLTTRCWKQHNASRADGQGKYANDTRLGR